MAYLKEKIADFVDAPRAKPDNYMQKAADLLRKHGHVKGVLRDGDRMCLAGAWAMAKHGSPLEVPWASFDWPANSKQLSTDVALLEKAAYGATSGDDLNGWHKLVAWNNSAERTADEVIAVFEKAAKELG